MPLGKPIWVEPGTDGAPPDDLPVSGDIGFNRGGPPGDKRVIVAIRQYEGPWLVRCLWTPEEARLIAQRLLEVAATIDGGKN